MDPFARGDGQDRTPPKPASGDAGQGGSSDWGWPSPDDQGDPSGTGSAPAGGPGGDAEPDRQHGLGDPPPEWRGQYAYPPARYSAPGTGRSEPPPYGYPPYADRAYPPPAFPSPGPGGVRRRSHPGLFALAVVACVAILAVAVGGGVGAAVLYRHATGPTAARQRGGTKLPRSGNNGALDLQALAARFDPSIVDITGVQQDAAGDTVEEDAGTGLIISSDGQVLTNNHVIEGDRQLQATVSNGDKYALKVLGEDPTDDIALVQIQGASGLPAVDPRSGTKPAKSEAVAAFGNALGRGGTPAATQGQVTNLDQTISATLDDGSNQTETLTGLIEMSAQICPGDSGGVLTNVNGQYLGILTAASTSNNQQGPGSGGGSSPGSRPRHGGGSGQNECSGDGFAIPAAHAVPVIKQIRSGRRSSKVIIGVPGFLGVEVQECTEESTQEGSCQAPAVDGAEITQVIDGGAAQQAGLPESFVITAIDQTPVTGPNDLTTALQQTTPGQTVQVTWNDGQGGTSQTTSVTLAAGPPA